MSHPSSVGHCPRSCFMGPGTGCGHRAPPGSCPRKPSGDPVSTTVRRSCGRVGAPARGQQFLDAAGWASTRHRRGSPEQLASPALALTMAAVAKSPTACGKTGHLPQQTRVAAPSLKRSRDEVGRRSANGRCRELRVADRTAGAAARLPLSWEAANGCTAVDYRSSRPSHDSPKPSGFFWRYEITISP